jgi:hypothetical protein
MSKNWFLFASSGTKQDHGLPLPGQRVRMRLPEGARPSKVQLLLAGQTPRLVQAGGYLEVTVPSVLDHEVVAVGLPS